MGCRAYVVPAIIALLAGCGDGTDPGGIPLVGRFGNPEQHVELLAVHGGAELHFPCGAHFSTTEPILLRPDRTFRRAGRWHPANIGGPLPPRDAVVSGFDHGGSLTVSMRAEAEEYTIELERNVSGDVDAVLCALRPASGP
jgi:hypothetical protein